MLKPKKIDCLFYAQSIPLSEVNCYGNFSGAHSYREKNGQPQAVIQSVTQHCRNTASLAAAALEPAGLSQTYYLGNQYKTKIEHFGAKETYEPEGVLMI